MSWKKCIHQNNLEDSNIFIWQKCLIRFWGTCQDPQRMLTYQKMVHLFLLIKKNWCSQEREKLREDLAKEIKMVGYFALNGDVSFIMKPSLPSLPQPLQNNWCEWIYWGNW